MTVLDLPRIDQNLQTIRQTTASWNLPALPDTVMLDLASRPEQDPSTLSDTLGGLHADINAVVQPSPVVLPSPPVEDPFQTSALQQLKVMWDGIAGFSPPTTYNSNSTETFKREAVKQGYLDPTTDVTDPNWYPELNSVRRDMMTDNFSRTVAGDHPGATTLGHANDFIGNWLTPTGLLSKLVDFKFLPDPKAIVDETTGWLGKIQKAITHPSISNTIDAATGPLDDIIVPLVNTGLLLFGVGEVYNFARIGLVADEALAGGEIVRGLYTAGTAAEDVGRLGRVVNAGRNLMQSADYGADAARFGEQSFTSRTLARLGTPAAGEEAGLGKLAAQKASNVMDGWRNLNQIKLTKKIVQQGMRLGLVGGVENAALPGLHGFSVGSIGNTSETVAHWRERAWTNPLTMGMEALFTPVTIFEPGTLGKIVGGAGHTAGRALIGAAYPIPGLVAHKGLLAYLPVKKLRLAPVTENHALAMEFHAGARMYLQDTAPDLLAHFDEMVSTHGAAHALAETFTGGDKEVLGRKMTYIATAAAIDHHAAMEADLFTSGASRTEDKWLSIYHLIRNKDTAQLQYFDPNDLEGIAMGMAKMAANKPSDVVSEFQKWRSAIEGIHPGQQSLALDDASPVAKLQATAVEHNARREAHWRDLLDSHMAPGTLTAYLPQVMPTFGRWGEFTDAMQQIESAHATGLLNDSLIKEAFSPAGRRVSLFPEETSAARIARGASPIPFNMTLFDDPGYMHWMREGLFGPLAKAIDPGIGKFTAMRAETATRQTYLSFYAQIRSMMRASTYETRVAGSGHSGVLAELMSRGLQHVEETGEPVTGRLLDEWMTEIGMVGRQKPKVELGRLLGAPDFPATIEPGLMAHLDDAAAVSRVDSTLAARADELKTQIAAMPAAKLSEESRVARATQSKVLQRVDHARALIRDIRTGGDTALIHGGKETDRIKSLYAFMRREGMTDPSELRPHIDQALLTLDNSPEWSAKYGIDSHQSLRTKTDTGRIELSMKQLTLEDKAKILRRKAKWVAAEVDAPAELADGLARTGYKLVHGVEYLMPGDLLSVQPFADFNEAQLRTASLGNFFKAQAPAPMSSLLQRTLRANIHAAVSRLPEVDRVGVEVSDVAGKDLNTVVDSLYGMLRQQHEHAQQVEEMATHGGVIARTSAHIATGRTPRNLLDLGLNSQSERVIRGLTQLGYSEPFAQEVWKALKISRRVGFNAHGLVEVENHLRSQPILLDGLNLLGHTDARDLVHELPQAMRAAKDAAVAASHGEIKDALGLAHTAIKPLERGAAKLGAVAAPALAADAATSDNPSLQDFNPTSPTFNPLALAAGVAGAAGLKVAQGSALPKAIDALQHNTRWMRYAYLADDLTATRDFFRFSLSPIFDVSRYTHAVLLGQIADLPEGVQAGMLPFNQSPRAFVKEFGAADWTATKDAFAQAARGQFDPETLDETSRWFTQHGILGFNNNDWMASTFGRLTKLGVGNEAAYDAVRNTYTYGTTGRSAFEQSVNFVFFPFSFQKKVLTHLAKTAAQDMSRTAMLHDAVKIYDTLDKNFDLHDRWRAYLPLAAELRRLNLLRFGVGPGELGGINRPLLDFFLPVGAHIAGASAAADLQGLAHRSMPVWGDAESMLTNLADQGHVLFSKSHLANKAEISQGWDEWIKTRNGVERVLKDTGYKMGQVASNPALAPIKDFLNQQKAQLADKYPAWWGARNDSIANHERQAAEIEIRTAQPKSNADLALTKFVTAEKALAQSLSSVGLTFENPEDVPPEVFRLMRSLGIALASETPGFGALYKRFFLSKYGPIETELH